MRTPVCTPHTVAWRAPVNQSHKHTEARVSEEYNVSESSANGTSPTIIMSRSETFSFPEPTYVDHDPCLFFLFSFTLVFKTNLRINSIDVNFVVFSLKC